MKSPFELKKLKLISKILGVVWLAVQVKLVLKYSMIWWEWLVPLLLIVGIIWLIRVFSISDGMIHTVVTKDFYDKMKHTLLDNYKRNKDEPN